MPAIQNQINLYVNVNGQIVPGSEPINFLYRNNLNRNIFFVITPLSQAAVVKLIFKNTSLNKQGYIGIALATTQTGKDITNEEVSYYDLVKDWNVFKYIPNSTILTKFPSTVTGSISLTVSITEPDLSDTTRYTHKGDLFTDVPVSTLHAMEVNEFYTCASAEISLLNSPIEYPVITIYGGGFPLYNGDRLLCLDKDLQHYQYVIIRALKTQSTTEPLQFVGNPSLEDGDFEYDDIGDISLLDSIISKQTEQTISIGQLQHYISGLNNIIIPFNTRLDQVEFLVSSINIEGKVDKTTKINGKTLDTDIVLGAISIRVDSGASPFEDYTITEALDSLYNHKVFKTTTVNGKALTDNITLFATDIKLSSGTSVTVASRLDQLQKPNGTQDLIVNNKVNMTYIPDSILGNTRYMGTFTGNIFPVATALGQYWIYKGPGAVINGEQYTTGDWALYNGTTFEQVKNTDAVRSVAGKIGDVDIHAEDIIGLAEAIDEAIPVKSVAGKTGEVIINTEDVEGLDDLINNIITIDRQALNYYIDNRSGVVENFRLTIDTDLQYGKQYRIKYADIMDLLGSHFDNSLGEFWAKETKWGFPLPIVIEYFSKEDNLHYALCLARQYPNRRKTNYANVTTHSLPKYYCYLTRNKKYDSGYDEYLILSISINEEKVLASTNKPLSAPLIMVLNTPLNYAHDNARYVVQSAFRNEHGLETFIKALDNKGLLQHAPEDIYIKDRPICVLRGPLLSDSLISDAKNIHQSITNAFSRYISVRPHQMESVDGDPTYSLEINLTGSQEETLKDFENAIRIFLGLQEITPGGWEQLEETPERSDYEYIIGFAQNTPSKANTEVFVDGDHKTITNLFKYVGAQPTIFKAFMQFLTLRINTDQIGQEAPSIGRKNKRLALYMRPQKRPFGTPDTWYPVIFFKPFWDFYDDSGTVDIQGIFRIEPAIIARGGVIERKKKSLIPNVIKV